MPTSVTRADWEGQRAVHAQKLGDDVFGEQARGGKLRREGIHVDGSLVASNSNT